MIDAPPDPSSLMAHLAVVVVLLPRPAVRHTAALHLAHLPHGFFARLGPRFLRIYHTAFIDSPHAVAFAAMDGDQRVGMLLGTLDTGAHRTWMLRNRGGRLAAAGILGLLARPPLVLTFLRTRARDYLRRLVRHLRRRIRPASAPVEQVERRQVAVLVEVVVEPHARGSGAGRALVEAFVAAATDAGAERAVLVTQDDGGGAATFYARLGWVHTGSHEDRDGNALRQYTYDLRDPDTA